MTEHGFFIPDVEYLIDLEGFIKYLGEKISVGNVCLHCNGKGKAFWTLEAVQTHMRDVSHCKLLYEGNEEEYQEFYDFSTDYDTKNEVVTTETENEESIKSNVKVSESGCELIFTGTGKTVGHRSLATYYRQKIKPPESRDSVIINSLMMQYKLLGWTTNKHHTSIPPVTRPAQRQQAWANLKQGLIGNNQKHFRDSTSTI